MASSAPPYTALACTLLIAGMVAAAARLFSRLLFPAVGSSKSTSTPPPVSNVVDQAFQQNETAPQIFLSHSGFQKDFVGRLHDALENAGHRPFFDRDTIPIATQLPEYINRCARDCRLGVVVLSSEYVTTKWPMLELVVMTKTPDVEIYPLFFGLTVDDLIDQENLSIWRRKWKRIAAKDKSIDVSEWENAVKSLHDRSGAVFSPITSETVYIRNIVAAINKKIRPVIAYDVSYVKGHDRLIKEIDARFDSAKSVYESSSRPRAVGLYGVGGMGKTTLCKMMVNFYMSQYAGKSVLMEFPTKGNHESKKSIVKECKKVLRCLITISETLLEQIDDFDKIVEVSIVQLLFIQPDNIQD